MMSDLTHNFNHDSYKLLLEDSPGFRPTTSLVQTPAKVFKPFEFLTTGTPPKRIMTTLTQIQIPNRQIQDVITTKKQKIQVVSPSLSPRRTKDKAITKKFSKNSYGLSEVQSQFFELHKVVNSEKMHVEGLHSDRSLKNDQNKKPNKNIKKMHSLPPPINFTVENQEPMKIQSIQEEDIEPEKSLFRESVVSSPIKQEFRYCLGCEQAVLHDNIDYHSQICPLYLEVFGKTTQELVEYLKEKISGMQEKVNISIADMNLEEVQQLGAQSNSWTSKIDKQLDKSELSGSYADHYNSLGQKSTIWLDLFESIHRLNWFIHVRQRIVSEYGI